MESIDTQSDLAMIDNIEFEEKADIEKLVLMAEQTKVPNIEFSDNENELLENARSIHDARNNFDLKMEENILKLFDELEKDKSESPVVDFSQRRSLKIRQVVERIRKHDDKMLSENITLRARISDITEEHKTILLLNAKNTNSIIKIYKKALDDKKKMS